MILSLLLFGGVAFLLTFEGKLLLQLLTRGNLARSEVWTLGFPMGAFINVLLFFLCTLVNIPLTGDLRSGIRAVVGHHVDIIHIPRIFHGPQIFQKDWEQYLLVVGGN